MIRPLVPAALALLCAASAAAAPSQVDVLTERYLALRLKADPTMAYSAGLPTKDHAHLPDLSPGALQRVAADEDKLWDALQKVQPATEADRTQLVVLQESVAAARRQRVCKLPLWSVNHFTGWQAGFGMLAEQQPIGTAALRKQALQRWGAIPTYIAQDTANLRAGLAQGYSAPKAVVQRVIQQLDRLLTDDPEASPLFAPAKRDKDPAFRAALRKIIADKIQPAIRAHRAFLADTYLPQARDALGVSALPDGRACYAALLQNETTLSRTPEQVHALGKATVEANRADIIEIGRKQFGTDSFEEIVRRTADAPDNKFASEDEFLSYSNKLLDSARAKTAPFFAKLPDQPVRIEPTPAYLAGTGRSAHYVAENDRAKPGTYVIPLSDWGSETRGSAEVTLVHETLPGHHLQIALAREYGSGLSGLTENGAYIEGWARYSERLAEEAGIYETPYARITRRVWPAWGMVVDPGVHALGWTREQAVAALVSSGRFDAKQADTMVDRIAALPGQLTSYDSGGLEIFALRREAEAALGARFDVKRFHERILSAGPLPLSALRERVEAWIKSGGA